MPLSNAAKRYLHGNAWPGNVRELENAIERALVLGTAEEVLVEDLPDEVVDSGTALAPASTYQESLRERKRELIRNAVAQAGGNYTRAAEILELHPNYLHRLINNLKLRQEFQSEKK